MDALEAIRTRRSIRKYTGQPVAEPDIQAMLTAAMMAPTALDQRPWHFVVIRQATALRLLAARMPKCDMLRTASLGIVVCGDTRLEKIPGYWIQDCCACTQNLLLAAHARGLGAVWIALHPGIPDRELVVRDACRLPAPVIPLALVAIGHPDEAVPSPDRFDVARVHSEQW